MFHEFEQILYTYIYTHHTHTTPTFELLAGIFCKFSTIHHTNLNSLKSKMDKKKTFIFVCFSHTSKPPVFEFFSSHNTTPISTHSNPLKNSFTLHSLHPDSLASTTIHSLIQPASQPFRSHIYISINKPTLQRP